MEYGRAFGWWGHGQCCWSMAGSLVPVSPCAAWEIMHKRQHWFWALFSRHNSTWFAEIHKCSWDSSFTSQRCSMMVNLPKQVPFINLALENAPTQILLPFQALSLCTIRRHWPFIWVSGDKLTFIQPDLFWWWTPLKRLLEMRVADVKRAIKKASSLRTRTRNLCCLLWTPCCSESKETTRDGISSIREHYSGWWWKKESQDLDITYVLWPGRDIIYVLWTIIIYAVLFDMGQFLDSSSQRPPMQSPAAKILPHKPSTKTSLTSGYGAEGQFRHQNLIWSQGALANSGSFKVFEQSFLRCWQVLMAEGRRMICLHSYFF